MLYMVIAIGICVVMNAYLSMKVFGTKPKPDTDLEVRVRVLEQSYKTLETEWTEMYDKFRRLHMRLAKRDQREREDPPEQPNGKQLGVGEGSDNPLALKLLGRVE